MQIKNSSRGAVSKMVIILGVVLVILVIVIFIVIKMAANNKTENSDESSQNEPPKPVYETQVGDVKFTFQSAINIGNTIKSESQFRDDLVTTERFIKVIIGAQNKGKINIDEKTWDVGNIIDSEGRHFVSVEETQGYISQFSGTTPGCGSLLKPEFAPVPCVKTYEVSKGSKELKVEVNVTKGRFGQKETALLDLVVIN